ncbi:MAG: TIGR03546 family protein [Endomicrobium sp.]|jgi:uncharacterized protein (TIGR03546 family)|nr:TIGR03546 family protein [Endomicrobium sp.]
MFLIKMLKSVLAVLNTDASPYCIACGAVIGIFFGLIPGFVPKLIIFLFIMILRVNIGSAFACAAFFAAAGLIIDPLADKIGYFILNAQALIPLWTFLYNLPVVPFSKFYNTVVMGNFALSILFCAPVFFAAIKFTRYYRANLRQKVLKWRIMKLLTAGSLSAKFIK